jgi:hypothetical protein
MAVNTLVIFSDTGQLSSSADGGATWTARTLPTELEAVVGAEHDSATRWMAYGRRTAGSPNHVRTAHSTDLASWTVMNSPHSGFTSGTWIPDAGVKYCNFGSPLWVYAGYGVLSGATWANFASAPATPVGTWTNRTASPYTASAGFRNTSLDCHNGTAAALGINLNNYTLYLVTSTTGTSWTDSVLALPAAMTTAGFMRYSHTYGTRTDSEPTAVIQYNRHVQRWQIIVIYERSLRVWESATQVVTSTYTEVATITRDFVNAPFGYLHRFGSGGFVRSTRHGPTQLGGMMSYCCRSWVPIVNYAAQLGVNVLAGEAVNVAVLPSAKKIVVGTQTDGAGATVALADSLHESMTFSTTNLPTTGKCTGVAYSVTTGATDLPCVPIINLARVLPAAGIVSTVPIATTVTTTALAPSRGFSESISDGASAALTTGIQLGWVLSSNALASDAASMQAFWYLASSATATDSLSNSMVLAGLISDEAVARDTIQWNWIQTLADSANASDSVSAVLSIVQELTESLLASGVITSSAVFNEALGVVAVASDSLVFAWVHTLSDTASASDLVSVLRTTLPSVSDSATASDATSMLKIIPVLLTENLQATDALTVSMVIQESLRSTAVAHFFIAMGDAVYDAWTLNTESLGATEYTNFNFNSFARFNNRYYATGEDGIYLLEGADDDGTDIAANIRTGIESLGTEYMKSIPNVYIGYKTDGQMVLKTVTTSAGVKKENWYALNAVQKDVASDNRFSIAKGVHSVYWQFELANYEGSDFELENLKLWRLVLSRRK